MVCVDVKQHGTNTNSCVKVEEAVLGSPSLTVLMGLCGRKSNMERTPIAVWKVEEAVLGSPSLTVLMVCVDVKQHGTNTNSCVKVEEAVLGSPSLTVLMVCVDVKQHGTNTNSCVKVEEAVLGSPSLTVPYGLCGRKATWNEHQ